jgi:hypothetical protein
MVVAFILSEEDERTAKAAGWLSRLALFAAGAEAHEVAIDGRLD